jgi:hypothetical protein
MGERMPDMFTIKFLVRHVVKVVSKMDCQVKLMVDMIRGGGGFS